MKKRAGFTLLEMLVVITIIVLLAVILIPNIFGSKKQADISSTKAEIMKIKGMIEQYKNKWGDYPPTSIVGFTDPNNLNQGIETLVACLANTSKGGPFLDWQERRYSNFDDDSTAVINLTWRFGDNKLREITDLWRQPFVYFHARDYVSPGAYASYQGSDDLAFSATPQMSSETSTYHNPEEYQIWSIGPDCENQNGAGDDISNW